MLPYTTTKKLKCVALLIPTLLLSFISIGTVLGDTAQDQYYYTPSDARSDQEMILDEYAHQSIYLIDFTRLEFIPTSIQIERKDALMLQEELGEEEHLQIYEIDLGHMPEDTYKITITDGAGNSVIEKITHTKLVDPSTHNLH